MGGQQYQDNSVYARVDYVQAQLKELQRKHDYDMEGVKKSFEVAGQKQQELKELVSKLEARCDLLQELLKDALNQRINGSIANDNTSAQQRLMTDQPRQKKAVWVKTMELLATVRANYPREVWNKEDFGNAMVKIGYAKRFLRPNGNLNNIIPTKKGLESKLLSATEKGNSILYNISRCQEIVDIVRGVNKQISDYLSSMEEE